MTADGVYSGNHNEVFVKPNCEKTERNDDGVKEGTDRVESTVAIGAIKKKTKKKKKKISTFPSTSLAIGVMEARMPSQHPSAQRGLNQGHFTDYPVQHGQTNPPTIPVALLFESQNKPLPQGEIQSYRETRAEQRAVHNFVLDDMVQKLRLAAEIHRHTRAFAQSIIKPGICLADMCEGLENKNRELCDEAGLRRGIAFPTGCSLNHVAAHYTPNIGDATVLQYDDVMKVDFGVQIDGYIIDSAWTVAFNQRTIRCCWLSRRQRIQAFAPPEWTSDSVTLEKRFKKSWSRMKLN
jgi:methionyl aminopeptidase